MKYIIPTFNCDVIGTNCFSLLKNVKYQIELTGENLIVFSTKTIPFVLNLNNENILKVDFEKDTYYFVFPINYSSTAFNKFKFNSHEVLVSLSNTLLIFLDSELICEQIVENLKFSHQEIVKDFCFIYFEGKRNFVVVLKNDEVVFCSYYDEFNSSEKEKYFMCKLNDSLNHGEVFHLNDKESEKYLVYLDDEDLNLNIEFLPLVFLDCVKAKNYKYCNKLLSENLKVEDENLIGNFFSEFDFIYPITSNKIILINKNTLAGIFEFVIENNYINNIKSL